MKRLSSFNVLRAVMFQRLISLPLKLVIKFYNSVYMKCSALIHIFKLKCPNNFYNFHINMCFPIFFFDFHKKENSFFKIKALRIFHIIGKL